jgi:hypothetical protein
MIKSEQTPYGFRFFFISPISAEETAIWSRGVASALGDSNEEFCVFADFRQCVLFPVDCKTILEEAQTCCRVHGMVRSVVVLKDEITAMQLRIVARKTGILEWERYVSCEDNPDWEDQALGWISQGIEPENPRKPRGVRDTTV